MLARLEKLISELDGLVDDIEEQDSELGLLASEIWETLRDIAGRLKGKEAQIAAADCPTNRENASNSCVTENLWEDTKTNAPQDDWKRM